MLFVPIPKKTYGSKVYILTRAALISFNFFSLQYM